MRTSGASLLVERACVRSILIMIHHAVPKRRMKSFYVYEIEREREREREREKLAGEQRERVFWPTGRITNYVLQITSLLGQRDLGDFPSTDVLSEKSYKLRPTK
jgi:hypothetical protein